MKNKNWTKFLLLALTLCLSLALLIACGSNAKTKEESNSDGKDSEENDQTTSSVCEHVPVTDAAVAATCTTTGLSDGSHCEKCGEILTEQEEIPAKGHSWSAATCIKPKTCKVCNETEGIANGHKLTTSLNCNVCKKAATNEDCAIYASIDFMSVRSKYSTATPTGAYVTLFVNQEGDVCVLTWVFYKLISSYNVTTLHNLTDGTRIENPEDYYDKLADQYSGANRLHYLSMAGEILKHLSNVDNSAAYISSSEIIYY